jgi:hypothetical protein
MVDEVLAATGAVQRRRELLLDLVAGIAPHIQPMPSTSERDMVLAP